MDLRTSSVFLSFVFFLLSTFFYQLECATFAFGNTQGSNMVLQQAPNRAKVWGMSNVDDVITVSLYLEQQLIETIHARTNNDSLWYIYFNPRQATMDAYTITAHSNQTNAVLNLTNILFGDVYICSGQSNMQFTVDSAFNSTEELNAANDYPFIRLFTATEIGSDSPQINLLQIEERWSIASNTSVGGGNWSYFSAVCWFFGRNLFNELKYPIGLIGTDYGGTPVRFWSSPEVNAECNETSMNSINHNSLIYDNTLYMSNKSKTITNLNINKRKSAPLALNNSDLWNAMIYPFLQTTIKGAIWYQGEADSNNEYAPLYSCAFPSMIRDWRLQWSLRSDTSPDFPFGFVQLSTWNDGTANKTCGNNVDCTDVAIVRWAQTGNYGYLPNPDMLNTFFATAVDLGDPNSPFGDVHPRYKQQVGERLSNAALNQIYGESNIYINGPIPNKASISGSNLMINFRNVNQEGLEIRNSYGFEVLSNNNWITITDTITINDNYNILLPLPSSTNNVATQVRYNWFQAPCFPELGIYNCGIYDKASNLPATPFIINVS